MKSSHAAREEKILEFWKKEQIFEKSLEKNKDKGKEFVFYEGPPTANGRPGIHHLEARAFKDAIPRYKTMQGFYVRRKGGWDTHGLPVEIQVEKELGLKSKKEVESYGIQAFNDKCKESVWTYVHEWEDFTKRMGYWVDLKDPYITYKPQYIESVWNILKAVHERHLLYKDYKVLPWCPRCGTALSSHELAQGYDTAKDLSVTVEFRLVAKPPASFLAWTTTPWTLPGNVALAINPAIRYAEVEMKNEAGIVKRYILAKDLVAKVFAGKTHEIVGEVRGQDLVGLDYEPLFPFLKQHVSGAEKEKMANAYKVYAADFVTTTEGTGIVHTAVMYGQDDFELGTKVGLPKYHLVNEDGTFKVEAGFLGMRFVKDEETDIQIIKDLAHRGLLFHKEKHEHAYPFCWRCKTPLVYFARDSWYIRMSDLRQELTKENEKIHWEPGYIKEGRFGEWLREVKDWAISRERYWGTPLPVWICERCNQIKVVGKAEEVSAEPKNTYYVMRHGEAENNVQSIISGVADAPHHLTEKGKSQVAESAKKLKKIRFDHIYVSPFVRTRETLEILRKTIAWKDEQIHTDDRIRELGSGSWNGRSLKDYLEYFSTADRFGAHPDGVENYAEIKKRMGDFLYDMESKHKGQTILVITHETPEFLLEAAAKGLDRSESMAMKGLKEYIKNAEVRKLDFKILPHNSEYELDLHRPFIDEIRLPCECKGEMKRVKEVMDVWFDSGAMPFAQDHYPFEEKKEMFGLVHGRQRLAYPADFISEAIDQTRGWFYTLHAIGVLMGKGLAYKNVICLGHILDGKGKKMSKSIGNVLNPFEMMDKFGADALRFWMYSVNQPGESKNFDEKTVDEVNKKVFNLAQNVMSFYRMYEVPGMEPASSSPNILDQWIIARLNELVATVTKDLDRYVFLDAARAIRDFIGDLSQWYLRRSRDRFKEEGHDKELALSVTKHVLLTLAKVMAPFTPYFSEFLYVEMGGPLESVHLEDWPEAKPINNTLLSEMKLVREFSSLGLEARMASKINVRQPLQTMRVKNEKFQTLTDALKELIRDEVNVKEVAYYMTIEKDVELDTQITLELKEEGELRELLRKIQDLRKEKGLSIKDRAVLIAPNDLRDLVGRHEEEIKSSTLLSGIEFGDSLSIKV